MGVGPQKAVDGEVREHLERQRQAQAREASETKTEHRGTEQPASSSPGKFWVGRRGSALQDIQGFGGLV